MTNINPETNLPYGLIQARNLNADLWAELHLKAHDLIADKLREFRRTELIEAGVLEHDIDAQLEDFCPEIDEPEAELEHEGLKVVYTHLGGAAIVFSINGPVTHVASYCSPCAPGAADLDSGEGNIECHGVPADWLAEVV